MSSLENPIPLPSHIVQTQQALGMYSTGNKEIWLKLETDSNGKRYLISKSKKEMSFYEKFQNFFGFGNWKLKKIIEFMKSDEFLPAYLSFNTDRGFMAGLSKLDQAIKRYNESHVFFRRSINIENYNSLGSLIQKRASRIQRTATIVMPTASAPPARLSSAASAPPALPVSHSSPAALPLVFSAPPALLSSEASAPPALPVSHASPAVLPTVSSAPPVLPTFSASPAVPLTAPSAPPAPSFRSVRSASSTHVASDNSSASLDREVEHFVGNMRRVLQLENWNQEVEHLFTHATPQLLANGIQKLFKDGLRNNLKVRLRSFLLEKYPRASQYFLYYPPPLGMPGRPPDTHPYSQLPPYEMRFILAPGVSCILDYLRTKPKAPISLPCHVCENFGDYRRKLAQLPHFVE